MKSLNKKWLKISVTFLALSINIAQTCYAEIIDPANIVLNRTTDGTELYKFLRLSTDNTHTNGGDNVGRPYETFFWPINIPLIHPYNPSFNLRGDGDNDPILYFPEFILTADLGTISREQIPSTQIKAKLAEKNITTINHYVVIQNNPWKTAIDILFRPQPWLHQNAKVNGANNFSSNIWAYYAPATGQFNIQPDTTNGLINVTTHPGVGLVFSSDAPKLGKFDPNTTHMLYTVCIDDSTPKAALTLHILCNDSDHDKIKKVIASLPQDQLSLLALLDRLAHTTTVTPNLLGVLQDFTHGVIRVTPN